MNEAVTARLKIFRNAEQGPLLSNEEISKLLSLRRKDGQSLILTGNDSYNTANQIYVYKFDPIYKVLSQQVWNDFNDAYRQFPVFELSRRRQKIEIAALKKPIEVAKGITPCKRCGSEETLTRQKQVRSADEPMTLFVRCVHCNSQWTE